VYSSEENKDALNQLLTRDKELNTLYERLYEEKVLGNLTEDRFRSSHSNMKTSR